MSRIPLVPTALLIGLVAGGATPASALPCGTAAIPLSTLFSPGFSCTQQDKIWSNFTTSGVPLPSTGSATFNLVTPSPGVDQHTLTITDAFAQLTTYGFGYTITIDPASLLIDPALRITNATGGILLAAPGGAATLTKAFTDQSGTVLTGLEATASIPSVSVAIPGNVTQLNVSDLFYTDSSNVTGFANTFTEALAIPEPAAFVPMVLGLLGLGWVRSRSRRMAA